MAQAIGPRGEGLRLLVRNTFLHCMDQDGSEDANTEQPTVLRATTAPPHSASDPPHELSEALVLRVSRSEPPVEPAGPAGPSVHEQLQCQREETAADESAGEAPQSAGRRGLVDVHTDGDASPHNAGRRLQGDASVELGRHKTGPPRGEGAASPEGGAAEDEESQAIPLGASKEPLDEEIVDPEEFEDLSQPRIQHVDTPDPFDSPHKCRRPGAGAAAEFLDSEDPFHSGNAAQTPVTLSPSAHSSRDASPFHQADREAAAPAARESGAVLLGRLSKGRGGADLCGGKDSDFGEDTPQPLLVHVDTHDGFESPRKWSTGARSCSSVGGWQGSASEPTFAGGAPISRGSLPAAIEGTSRSGSAEAQWPRSPDVSGAERPAPSAKGSARRQLGLAVQDRAATGRLGQLARTTVMLRNLPNNYTRDGLLRLIDAEGFAGKYDFLYLPIDFRTHAALGYAFLNLVTPEDAERLRQRLDGFSRWALPSNKVCSVGWSYPHQGLDSHIARYRNSPLMHEAVPDGYRPILFQDGIRAPFPPPTKRIKPPRQGTQRMLV